jgi:peptide-methionine (S)-S-oxide reductase
LNFVLSQANISPGSSPRCWRYNIDLWLRRQRAVNQEFGGKMTNGKIASAVFGGGCFWCTEAVFDELCGVQSVISGYAGGTTKNPTYEQVCSGSTGHAEVIKIEFDPAQISFRDLMTVFFATHDPTTLNRQGNDAGTQYRSAILYADPQQKAEAAAFIKELDEAKTYKNPIVTTLEPLTEFYPAEDYHQKFYDSAEAQQAA